MCMYPCMSGVSMMAVYVVLFFEHYMLFILFFLLPVRFTLVLSNLMHHGLIDSSEFVPAGICSLAYGNWTVTHRSSYF